MAARRSLRDRFNDPRERSAGPAGDQDRIHHLLNESKARLRAREKGVSLTLQPFFDVNAGLTATEIAAEDRELAEAMVIIDRELARDTRLHIPGIFPPTPESSPPNHFRTASHDSDRTIRPSDVNPCLTRGAPPKAQQILGLPTPPASPVQKQLPATPATNDRAPSFKDAKQKTRFSFGGLSPSAFLHSLFGKAPASKQPASPSGANLVSSTSRVRTHPSPLILETNRLASEESYSVLNLSEYLSILDSAAGPLASIDGHQLCPCY